tara:strand:- start:1042 stop:1308 length:267 start_codon:yes stop_codon:yes gene_type:complete
MRTIFHLEDRGGNNKIYHFMYLNLAGLYYIENGLYNVTDIDGNPNTFPILNKIVNIPSNKITYPINIHINHVTTVMQEAFDIIKDNLR